MLSSKRTRSPLFVLPSMLALAVLLSGSQAAPGQSRTRYPGKIVLVRGAFNVFSLGLDDLGEKLRRKGFDVEVSSPGGSTSAGAKARKAYQADPEANPIVIIGHSMGAKLAPKMAEEMQRHNVPVRLIFILDAPERTSIPANVERCVNYYQSIPSGFVRGYPSRAQGPDTDLVNFDVARKQGISLNHFNIDATDWVHDVVIAEVIRSCTQPQASAAAKREGGGTAANPERVAAMPYKRAPAAGQKVGAMPREHAPKQHEITEVKKVGKDGLGMPWQPSDVEPRAILPRTVK